MNASLPFCKVNHIATFFLIIFFNVLSIASTIANPIVQKEYVLEFYGKAKFNGKPIEGVNFELKKEGATISTQQTKRSGKFEFEIPISTANKNTEYVINVSKKGFLTKKISVNTFIPQQEISENHLTKFICIIEELVMIEFNENEIVLVNPSARFRWETNLKEFTYDVEFAKTAKKEEQMLLENPEKYSEYIESKKPAKSNNIVTKEKEKVNVETNKMNDAKSIKDKTVKENIDSKNNRMTAVDEAVGTELQLEKIEKKFITSEKEEMADKEIVVKINARKEIKKEENLLFLKEQEKEKEVKANKDAKYSGNNRFSRMNEALGEEELKKKELKIKK
ncbi:MAG: hypothetical protein A3F72_10615 [Bacteroidetes bacterium RIFCSPLOWO2_12_FULL_35_15]|nr:MAG: hypothetical protein A3F72_10615 [Bacteroidetes bacterium RIFCSPLOWO2_12_FULL_35_15]